MGKALIIVDVQNDSRENTCGSLPHDTRSTR
jgi:hypothetical protein